MEESSMYKMAKGFILLSVIAVFLWVMIAFECNALTNIAGVFLGVLLPEVRNLCEDIFWDTTNWKVHQRKLQRANLINKKTIVRISFAYLYRIKVGNKYFLIKNNRGTEKYQPIGGVYKFEDEEKLELKNRFQVKDDDKISIDESSRNDYRLRMENKYLRDFVTRFNKKAKREKVDDLSREFKEELVGRNHMAWNQIEYRFCGRHMAGLHYGEHFQIYELFLADIVELLPTLEQEKDLMKLVEKYPSKYCWATAQEIDSLGINTVTKNLREVIADHSKKILQEKEGELLNIKDTGKTFVVKL